MTGVYKKKKPCFKLPHNVNDVPASWTVIWEPGICFHTFADRPFSSWNTITEHNHGNGCTAQVATPTPRINIDDRQYRMHNFIFFKIIKQYTIRFLNVCHRRSIQVYFLINLYNLRKISKDRLLWHFRITCT